MLVSELKELLSAVPDYYFVDVFSVEIGNGSICIQGDGFGNSTDTEEVPCPNCGTDVEAHVVYRLEPRPKTLPVTPEQEREAKEKLRELDASLLEINKIVMQLNATKSEIHKAWRPE